jgi:4-amino-4-deoxy-L-arabinose transferase-like glycosyltransferase
MRVPAKLANTIFVLAILATYFYALGILPLVGPDEPRYAQVAREMFERGDWITPTLGGANWFEKPVLLYWLEISAYNFFGVNEFSARLGSAVFGLLTVFSLWILGRFLDRKSPDEGSLSKTERQKPKNGYADWFALIAASTIGIIVFARGASFDIIVTFPITAGLVLFFCYDWLANPNSSVAQPQREAATRKIYASLIGFYVFCGVALLAKGLIGIIFPFAIAGIYTVIARRKISSQLFRSFVWGTILSLLVASVWYAPVYFRNGWEFIDEFFVQHHFARYVSNKYQHPQPFWFFFLVLPLMLIPWTPFLLASLWKIVRSFFVTSNTTQRDKPEIPTADSKDAGSPRLAVSSSGSLISLLQIFGLCWLAVPLIFFSFSGSKLPGYILPAVPAAIILTAEYAARLASANPKWQIAFQTLALGTFATIFVILLFFANDFARHETTKYLFEAAAEKGYANSRVLNLYTLSHNAEFYAAGRLVRSEDGKLRKFLNVSEVVEEMKRENGKPVLAIFPIQYEKEVSSNASINTKFISENGELAIAALELKQL